MLHVCRQNRPLHLRRSLQIQLQVNASLLPFLHPFSVSIRHNGVGSRRDSALERHVRELGGHRVVARECMDTFFRPPCPSALTLTDGPSFERDESVRNAKAYLDDNEDRAEHLAEWDLVRFFDN